jgi:predicted MFS family arabinose efflux permease
VAAGAPAELTGATRPRLDHVRLGVLGVATITAYGAWYYAFGALIDPIVADTGWSYTAVSASFSVGQVLVGAGSLWGGSLLDRRGSRPVFALAAVVGSGGLLAASFAESPLGFGAAAAIGMAALGALGQYHVTMATAVRLHPTAPGRAIAVLTLWGALASPIYLPATAALVDAWGWRPTVRVLALSAFLGLAGSALAVATGPAGRREDRLSWPTVVRGVFGRPGPRRFTFAVALAGLALSVLLVYQVPVMHAAGLSLTAAASVAGLRGVMQLSGRLPLTLLLRWLPPQRLLVIALGSVAVGAALLGVAGTIAIAVVFAVTAGFGIGAYSPLQGIAADELVERRALGASMGLFASVHMVAGAIGPVAAGRIADRTGDVRWAAVVAALAAAAAAGAMLRTPRGERTAKLDDALASPS